MTFCLGVKLADGIVALADTRVTSGSETIVASKLWTREDEGAVLFVMTAGLRSVRDKVLTYYEDALGDGLPFNRVFKAVNALAEQVRKVATEDRHALHEAGIPFDITCLVGGQFSGDSDPKLYLLYPQGNWVEVEEGTPYQIIGNTGYGKPVLDRVIKHTDPMRLALKVGMLSFDSTRISSNDVDFPVDVMLYHRDSFRLIRHRYSKDDLSASSAWWQENLRQLVHTLPEEWLDAAFRPD